MESEIESIPRSIRIFISHSHYDRSVAGVIKQALELYFGFEAFVAHEDIEPTRIFEDRILEELASTDVVLAILSKNFKESKYCDQEIGMAIAKEKFIIPINWGLIPYGFIAKFQAAPCKITSTELIDWIDFCAGIVWIIEDQDKFKGKTTDLIINALKNSYSYQTSRRIAPILGRIQSFTKLQVNQIFAAYINNHQVRDESYNIPPLMNHLIKKYSEMIDQDLFKRYEKSKQEFIVQNPEQEI